MKISSGVPSVLLVLSAYVAAITWMAWSTANAGAQIVLVALCTLVLASFLNVVRHRWPAAEDAQFKAAARIELGEEDSTPQGSGSLWKAVAFGRSACPNCGKTLSALELVPVLSWLFQRGNCTGCKAPVSRRYPIVEMLVSAGMTAAVFVFGVSSEGLLAAAIVWLAAVLALIDLDHLYLPETFSTTLVLAVAVFTLLGGMGHPLRDAASAALVGYIGLGLALPAVLKALTGRTALGQGDAVLFAVIGALAGPKYLPYVVLLAALFGALSHVLARRDDGSNRFPFGPALLGAAVLFLIFGRQLLA